MVNNLSSAYTPINSSPVQILKAISEVNKSPVDYDYQLHNDLINFSTNGSWYYTPNTLGLSYYVKSINRTRNLNKDFLMYIPEFKKYKELGYEYLFSDTTTPKKNQSPIAFIFQFRNRQKNCFDWNKCSQTTFNEYTTCLKGKPVLVNSKHCSFAFTYLPKYITSIKSIACILLNFVSPYTPSNQPLSFACYYRRESAGVDYPFKK
jgi:hypothetical protein